MKLRTSLAAFSLIESLLTLAITCFLVLSLSGAVSGVFQRVEESLFFLSFEHLYRDSQKLSSIKQEPLVLQIKSEGITNGYDQLALPAGIVLEKEQSIRFDQAGGNSSLAKIVFRSQDREVAYQLYIGSGNYKKTESKSLHSP